MCFLCLTSSWSSTSFLSDHCNTQIGAGLNGLYTGDAFTATPLHEGGGTEMEGHLPASRPRLVGPECVRRQRSPSPPGSSGPCTTALLSLRPAPADYSTAQVHTITSACGSAPRLPPGRLADRVWLGNFQAASVGLRHTRRLSTGRSLLLFCHVPRNTLPAVSPLASAF